MRVAYLVDENEHWQTMLDAIFAESFGRWGGRFTLIVPCENGTIRPAYISWLRAYDPDILYSYVDFDPAGVEGLHERFGSAFLVRHSFYVRQERDLYAYRPHLPVAPLSVLSVAAVLSRGDMIFPPQPVALLDTYLGSQASPFLQQNFGCYGRSLSPWPIAQDLGEYLRPVTYAPSDVQANPRIAMRLNGDVVSSEEELIDRIATQRNLHGLAQLSASLVPRLELNNATWSHTVNFVVGDSFTDRILFWNAAHFAPVSLGTGVLTLKVSQDDLNDARRFDSVIGIIKSRIHHPMGGNASHAHIAVRSASLPAAVLKQIMHRLKAANPSNAYSSECVDSVDELVPSERVLEHGRHHVEPGSPFQTHDWHELIFSDDFFHPPIVLPRHLREAPQLPMSAKQGLWQLDVDIERTVDHSWVQNVQHHWRLPRRMRMVGAFTRGYNLHHLSAFCMPRATASGLLSLMCGLDGSLPEVKIPPDETAFHYALCAPRDWWPFDPIQRHPKPGPAFDMRPSDKGRYLTALLRMSGNIHRAKEIFLSQFWKERFERLGAASAATHDRITAVIQRLHKRFKGGQISSNDEWARLATLVLAEARAERFPARFLKFSDLRTEFDTYREIYWAKNPPMAPREEWEEHEKNSLGVSLKYLCEREILHQGYEWRCRHCFNSNWVAIDDLKRSMVCEVCGETQPAPVAESWHFRINNFVREGLREHGLLPAIWSLAKIAERASTSFYYLAPHELFFTVESADAGKPDAEIDLLIVSDGIVHLIEAKTSAHGIDIAKSAELAKRLRPDVLTIAVMEPGSPALSAKLTELQRQLAGSGIEGDLMTLEQDDIEDSPSLPTGRSYRVSLF